MRSYDSFKIHLKEKRTIPFLAGLFLVMYQYKTYILQLRNYFHTLLQFSWLFCEYGTKIKIEYPKYLYRYLLEKKKLSWLELPLSNSCKILWPCLTRPLSTYQRLPTYIITWNLQRNWGKYRENVFSCAFQAHNRVK